MFMQNGVDMYKKSRPVVSSLGLYCLLMSLEWKTNHKGGGIFKIVF